MRLSASARPGFTLLELMLAMSLLALVLVSARMLLSSVADTKALIIRDAAHADSLRNWGAIGSSAHSKRRGRAGYGQSVRGKRTGCSIHDVVPRRSRMAGAVSCQPVARPPA